METEKKSKLVFLDRKPKDRSCGKLRITDWFSGCNTGGIVVERTGDYTFREALDLLMSVHCNENAWVRRIVRISPRKILMAHGLGPGHSSSWISIKGLPKDIRLLAKAIKEACEKHSRPYDLERLQLNKLDRLLQS